MEWSPTKLVLHVDGFDGHFGQEMLGDPHVAMETGHVQGGVAIMIFLWRQVTSYVIR
jgi:hypothetical protein